MSLLTGRTFSDLHALYSLFMPEKGAKALLSKMAIIEKEGGWRRLFNEIARQSALLNKLAIKSRAEAIREVKSGKGPLKGQWIHFQRILLRRGKYGGVSKAFNLMDITGQYVHPKPEKAHYLAHQKAINYKSNPFFPYTVGTGPTDAKIDELRRLLSRSKVDWITRWANQNLTYEFNLPFPYSEKKELLRADGFTKPGYMVTPDDLLRTTWELFPGFTYDHYDLMKHLVGERLPAKKFFAGYDPKLSIGGYYRILTKDRKMKARGVSPYAFLIQALMHAPRLVLKKMLAKHPSSHIEDQKAGFQRVHDRLCAGKPQSSIDITVFTDNTSLDLQVECLYHTLPDGPWKEKLIQAFRDACHLRLLTPYDDIQIQHWFGGPMGMECVYDSAAWFLLVVLSSFIPEEEMDMVGDDVTFTSIYDDQVLYNFERFGLQLSLKKSNFNTADWTIYCNRMVTVAHGVLENYKAKPIDLSNPHPMWLRYGEAVLDLYQDLSLSDKKAITNLRLVSQKAKNLGDLKYTYADYDTVIGGYSPDQLFGMGAISRDELYVMKYIVALMFSKAKMSVREVLDLKVSRPYKSKVTGDFDEVPLVISEVINFPSGDFLPRCDYSFLGREAPTGVTFLVTIRDIFAEWNHLIRINRVVREISIKPGYNPPEIGVFSDMIGGISRWHEDRGIPYSYMPSHINFGVDDNARDNLLPLAKALSKQSDNPLLPGSKVTIDVKDQTPLESDLAKYKESVTFITGVTDAIVKSFAGIGRFGALLLKRFLRSGVS
jgi:hypothetical protein